MTPQILLRNCNNFLEQRAAEDGFSSHTLRAYAGDFAQMLKPLGACRVQREHPAPDTEIWRLEFAHPLPPREISSEELLSLCRQAQSGWSALASATRNRKSAALKSLLRYLQERGLLAENLAVRISLPRAQRKLPTFFAVDEVMAVLATARADVDANRPDARLVWALISLLYGAGLRVGEACRLRWVDLSGEELRVLGKGHRERVVIVPPSIAEIVRSLPRNGLFIFGERPLPTTQAYRWVRRLGARAGLSRRLHPHALRHSLATHLLQGRMDLRILQDLLGHRSLATTERYVHLQVQDLARTMDSLHPLGRRTKTSTCES